MGAAVFETDLPFDQRQQRVAAVLCRIPDRRNLHLGLLFRGSDESCQVMHLGWEDALHNTWTWTRLWASPDAEPENLVAIAALCRLIRKRFQDSGKFPYALHDLDASFDGAGRLVLAEGAHGLTCATFVLAVFRAG
jgi:hypothetical protein